MLVAYLVASVNTVCLSTLALSAMMCSACAGVFSSSDESYSTTAAKVSSAVVEVNPLQGDSMV